MATAATSTGAARAVSYAMLIGAAVVFGAMPTLNNLSAKVGIPPIAYPFWFATGATLFSLAACLALRLRPGFTGRHVATYIMMGGMGMAIPMVLLTYAAPHVPASVVALIIALVPGLTYLLALFAGLDRFHWVKVLGLGFGFAGVAVLIVPTGGDSAAIDPFWTLATLAAPVLFASANIYAAKFRPPDAPAITMSFGQTLGAIVWLLPATMISGQIYVPNPAFGLAELYIILASLIFSTLITLFYAIVHREGPVFFSQFAYLNVLTGVLWAITILTEPLSPILFGALTLMLVGIVLVNRGAR